MNDNLGDLLHSGATEKNFPTAVRKGSQIVFLEYAQKEDGFIGDLLVAVDQRTANGTNTTDTARLACWWRDLIRDYLLINLGKPPAYPENHPPQCLIDVYERIEKAQEENPGLTPEERFRSVRQEMIDKEPLLYEQVESLYRTVPPDYHAEPDPFVDPKVQDPGDAK